MRGTTFLHFSIKMHFVSVNAGDGRTTFFTLLPPRCLIRVPLKPRTERLLSVKEFRGRFRFPGYFYYRKKTEKQQ